MTKHTCDICGEEESIDQLTPLRIIVENEGVRDIYREHVCGECAERAWQMVCEFASPLKGGLVKKHIFIVEVPNFHVVPTVRMTQRSKWSERAQTYIKNQSDLAWLFKEAYTGEPIAYPVIISFAAGYSDNRLRDLDNILKGICDALEKAGVVANDRWIKGCDTCRIVKADKPFLRVKLYSVTEKQ